MAIEPTITRVLVRSKTHLVQGDSYNDKCNVLKNKICQEVWNRDFDPQQDRWFTYGALFGYDNRRCYFLVDNGPHTADEIPVQWYEWTGSQLQSRLPSNPSEHEHPKTINIAYNLSKRDSVTECPSVREILNT
ncbi:hypothetical protein BN1723_014777 [Verticillium longisporum]|nr:hypothetical protein BN1723_014777 [Verticillium longisporum]